VPTRNGEWKMEDGGRSRSMAACRVADREINALARHTPSLGPLRMRAEPH
jgi:hypothetical protein